MEIIAHRGFWISQEEKNSPAAFLRSAQRGYGIETDVRDHDGKLVIAHNMPLKGEDHLLFTEFLKLYTEHAMPPGYLAINIKADGLQDEVRSAIEAYNIERYFVFDMSIPDTLGYQKSGLKFFSRLSEYEEKPVLFQESDGIWLDAFESTWYSVNDIASWLDKGKKLCIVSPELHKREHLSFWENIKSEGLHLSNALLLCTDFPDKATKFFNGQ